MATGNDLSLDAQVELVEKRMALRRERIVEELARDRAGHPLPAARRRRSGARRGLRGGPQAVGQYRRA